MILTPIVMLIAGALRGLSDGNVWIKSISISLAPVIFAAFFGNRLLIGIVVPFLILACAGGVWIRRSRRTVTALGE